VIKGIVIGFILAIAISMGCVFLYFSTGMAPVATADPPMPFEKKFANMALDAHIEKQHIPPSSVPADDLIFLPVRPYTNSTAPCVTDSQGSHPLTMRQRCFRSRHNCSVERV
jgi:hypothetical protein